MSAFFLLLAVVFYRVFMACGVFGETAWLQNVSPLAAMALCGAIYLPRRMAWSLPLAMLLVSDVIINTTVYHLPLLTWEIGPRYLALGLVTAGGFTLRGRVGKLGVLTASLAGSLLFYGITNTGSWLAEPLYARSFAGWAQALTSGLPGYPGTWWFYRQTLVGDVLFTALFLGCMALTSTREEMRIKVPRAQPAR